MVKGFSKMYNFSFFGQILFCKHLYYITGFWDKKFNFCKFADCKSRAQELSNDVSFVIFGHQTWDCLVFKYPSRDRVKIKSIIMNIAFKPLSETGVFISQDLICNENT